MLIHVKIIILYTVPSRVARRYNIQLSIIPISIQYLYGTDFILYRGHVNWDANDSKIFIITHIVVNRKVSVVVVVVHVPGNEPLLVGNGQEQNS